LTAASRRTSAEVPKEKSADGWLLPILGRIILVAGVIISALDHSITQYGKFAITAFGIFGVALFVVGLCLYAVARLTLGRLFSEVVRIKPEHRLITEGPYRIIRHLIYLGEIIIFLSIPIIFCSLYGFFVMLALIPLLLHRITIEEKVLSSRFGKEYEEYARKTKKLIPYIY
jgi:protein-S-isoprenylcysteine O-methyltransferase Ste14